MTFDRSSPAVRQFISCVFTAAVLVVSVGLAKAVAGRNDAGNAFDEKALEFFEKQIAPILKRRCYACHGHASGNAKGGLVLDSRHGWEKGVY